MRIKEMSFLYVFISLVTFSIITSIFATAPTYADKATDMFTQDIQNQAAYIRKKCGEKPDSNKTEKYNAWNSCYINYSYFIAETCPTLGLDATNQEKIRHYECKKKFYTDDKSTWDSKNEVIKKADGSTYMSNPDRDKDTSPQSCGGVKTVIIKCSASDNGVFGIILLIINVLASGIGVVAIGGFVFGAIKYASAQDDASQVNDAKKIMFNVTIGLILFALMYSLLQFIIPGGIFDRSLNVPGPQSSNSNSSGSNGDKDKDNGNKGNENSSTRTAIVKATFVYQNLNGNPSATQASVQKMKNTFSGRENVVYNFGEINEEHERSALRNAFGGQNWNSLDGHEPTAVRTGDKLKISRTQRVHLYNAGIASATPSGNLYITRISHTSNKNTKLAVINTHWIVNAYSDQGRDTPERQRIWDGAWKQLDSTASELHRDGYDIVLAGDLNRQGRYKDNYPTTAVGKFDVITSRGPDVILAMPAEGRKISASNPGFISAPPGGEAFHGTLFSELTFIDDGTNSDKNNQNTTSPENVKLRNFRDATTTTNGTVLKKGVLYRSAQLETINDTNINRLADILDQNTLILDVRVPQQVAREPDRKIPKTTWRNIPIEGLLDQEPMVTDPDRRSQVGVALKAASNAQSDVLIHCFAGKDRTGWLIAMIMYVNGASDAQVMKEYMKSEEDWPDGVKKEWLRSGLSALKKDYGSVNNYLKRGAGLEDADISRLKRKFGA